MAYFKDGKALMAAIRRVTDWERGRADDVYTLLYFAEIGPDRLRVKDIGTPSTPARPALDAHKPLETACDVRSEGDEYHCVRAKCHLRWDIHEDRPECPLLRKDY